jgi:hypothetical protein
MGTEILIFLFSPNAWRAYRSESGIVDSRPVKGRASEKKDVKRRALLRQRTGDRLN